MVLRSAIVSEDAQPLVFDSLNEPGHVNCLLCGSLRKRKALAMKPVNSYICLCLAAPSSCVYRYSISLGMCQGLFIQLREAAIIQPEWGHLKRYKITGVA